MISTVFPLSSRITKEIVVFLDAKGTILAKSSLISSLASHDYSYISKESGAAM